MMMMTMTTMMMPEIVTEASNYPSNEAGTAPYLASRVSWHTKCLVDTSVSPPIDLSLIFHASLVRRSCVSSIRQSKSKSKTSHAASLRQASDL